jgi:hypothetical protein
MAHFAFGTGEVGLVHGNQAFGLWLLAFGLTRRSRVATGQFTETILRIRTLFLKAETQ